MVDILKPVERALVIDPQIKPFVILVVGINGAGKTTTIGKLAHRLLAEGRSVMLAAGDTFRAAAREQLETLGRAQRGADHRAGQPGAEPAAVIFDALQAARARHVDVLIADTAGRLHTQTHLMEELKKIKRVLARLDPRAARSAAGARRHHRAERGRAGRGISQRLGVTGLVVTKLDGTAKGGIVLAIAQKLGIPIRFVGVGEESEDFGVFNAAEFVAALLKSEPGDTVDGAPHDPLRAGSQALSERTRGAWPGYRSRSTRASSRF